MWKKSNEPRVGWTQLKKDAFDMVGRGAIVEMKIGGKVEGKFRVYYRRKKDRMIFMREVKQRKIIVTPERVVFDRYCQENNLNPREQIWINSIRSTEKLRGLRFDESDVVYLRFSGEIPGVRDYVERYSNLYRTKQKP